MPLPKERKEDVGVSGFQAVKKIRGLLVDINVESQPETWDGEGQVVKVSLEDTIILEMFQDEDSFELKEGKFSFIMPYKLTTTGKIASGTGYNECWRKSAEEIGKLPSEFIGTVVTLEKQPRLLFSAYEMEKDENGRNKPKLDEDGNKIKRDVLAVGENGLPKYFCFVTDESADAENVQAYIKDKVIGLNETAAKRKLLIDQKAKQFPEFRQALDEGTLAEKLGLVLVDGKFQEVDDEASDS